MNEPAHAAWAAALATRLGLRGQNTEETLRRSVILLVTAIGGSASYAASVTAVGTDSGFSDPATWRWHVSSILDDQQRSIVDHGAGAGAFDQRYQRFSPLGLLQYDRR